MNEHIAMLEREIHSLKAKLAEARRGAQVEPVRDYALKTPDSDDVQLSELFGEKRDLLVVHNMGKHCPYCTLWADGFSSSAGHLNSRASFVLCSFDDPKTLKAFSESRGWAYQCVANSDDFAEEMGFTKDGKPWPGVSAFHREEDGSIVRTGKAFFGPGDDFCAVWHFFDLLKGGPGEWSPKYEYD